MGEFAGAILTDIIRFIDDYEENPDGGEHYRNWTVGLCDDESDLEATECEVIEFSGRANHIEAVEARDILLGMGCQGGVDYGGNNPENVYAFKE
jgi:hypothetical protein